ESRRVLGVRVIAAFSLLPVAALPAVYETFGLAHVLALFGGWLLAVVLLRRLGRRMEERADREARVYEGDPGTYARALEKLYEANVLPVVLRGKRTVHPHLYDRLVAAGTTPAYPRPAAPPRFLSGLAVALAAVVALGLT